MDRIAKSDHEFEHNFDHKFDHNFDHKLDHNFDRKLDHNFDHGLDHNLDQTRVLNAADLSKALFSVQKVDQNVKVAPSYLCFRMACMVFMVPRWI